jgi:hypothetical protein
MLHALDSFGWGARLRTGSSPTDQEGHQVREDDNARSITAAVASRISSTDLPQHPQYVR